MLLAKLINIRDMDSFYIFIGLFFLAVFLIGRVFDKFKIPWIFSALLIGLALSFKNPVPEVTSSETFSFMSELGMYFLLFIIGMELDIRKFKEQGSFIFKFSSNAVLFDFLLLVSILHFFCHYSWLISSLVAFSFCTVGEAVLVPILDKQKIIKTKLGQILISAGVIDDIFEILFFVLVTLFIGKPIGIVNQETIIYLVALFLLLFLSFKLLKENINRFKTMELETVNLVLFFTLFICLGLSSILEAASLGALMAGVMCQTFIPEKRLQEVEKEIKMLCYGLFAPFFFLKIGLDSDLVQILSSWKLVSIIFFSSITVKILRSIILTKNILNIREAILLGIGMSVRFSTGLVILTMIYNAKLINEELFSIIIGANMLSIFIVPVLFTYLTKRWSNAIEGQD